MAVIFFFFWLTLNNYLYHNVVNIKILRKDFPNVAYLGECCIPPTLMQKKPLPLYTSQEGRVPSRGNKQLSLRNEVFLRLMSPLCILDTNHFWIYNSQTFSPTVQFVFSLWLFFLAIQAFTLQTLSSICFTIRKTVVKTNKLAVSPWLCQSKYWPLHPTTFQQ